MARQPIYDRSLNLVGYELLYRRSGEAPTSGIDESMEFAALANILVEVGLDKLAGEKMAFVNVPSRLLGAEALALLPPNRVTIEILEDTPWNAEVAKQVFQLKALGYHLALDDYIFGDEHTPFLDHMETVKIDVMGMHERYLRDKFASIKRDGQVYLAEKVETHEMFQLCLELGFDLFQGYFFAKPNTVRGTGIPANYAMSISLLAKLQNPDITVNELDALIAGNVALCHKVLRLVNSAAMGLLRPVDSIKQALMFVGTERIRALASLALMTSMPGKLPELYNLAMIRAKFCEETARTHGMEAPEKHFTVGLLSILDALTDTPMLEVVSELPLSKDITDALCGLNPGAPCSVTLRQARSIEQGAWDDSLMDDRTSNAYVEAIAWAEEQETAMAA